MSFCQRFDLRHRLLFGAAVAVAILGGSAHASEASRTQNGPRLYRQHCAACHGADLAGRAGPALAGPGFRARWAGNPSGLTATIARTMPLDAPGSLPAASYRSIAYYLLAQGELPSGGVATQPDSRPADSRPSRGKTRSVSALPGVPQVFGTAGTDVPDDAELSHPGLGDWLRYNLQLRGQRYSRLTEITPGNASTLVPKCIFQTGEVGSFEASPLIRRGKLYVTTANGTYALDGGTCRKLWSYQYIPVGQEPLPVNRGIALYRGMAIRGTADGHLIALDAVTGKLLWDEAVTDSSKGGFISAAPVVFDRKLFVGEAGADFGAADHVYAFDAATGRHIWTFDIIPTDRRGHAQTWGGDPNPVGGSVWSTITIDPATRLLYVSTGNPGPDFDGRRRPGANLYTDSVVALDAATGNLRWYVQQNPHDVHDWDTAAAPLLYRENGRNLMAVGSKDGYLYLYDRDSRRLLARASLGRRENDLLPLSATRPMRVCPGGLGGVEWNGPAYDPGSHLVFVNSVDWCLTFELAASPRPGDTLGGTFRLDPPAAARGSLRAFDAADGKPRWIYDADAPMLAAITPTASGLLFTGSSGGEFLVFDCRTGRKLYTFYTGGAVAGGTSTYLVRGKQYVAVLSGNSSKSTWQTVGAATLIVFGLP